MNKVFLTIVMFLLIPPIAVCSNSAIGFKGGINLGWFGGGDWENYINYYDDTGSADAAIIRAGFSGGLFVTLGLFKYFSIQPEIFITNSGGNYTYTYLGAAVEGAESYTVLEIPVMLRPQLPVGPGNFYLEFGPDLVVIIGNGQIKEKVKGLGIFVGEIEPENRVVWCVTGGMGYDFQFRPGRYIYNRLLKISIDVRYTRALTRMYDDFDQYQNRIAIMLGFGFVL